jgi:hypothetical protein
MNSTNTTWEKFNLVEKYLDYKSSYLYDKYNQEMTEDARAKFN